MSNETLRRSARPLLLAAFLAGFAALPARGQAPPPADPTVESCGSEAHLEALLAADPAMAARRAAAEAMVQQAQAKGIIPMPTASSNVVYTIPVIVHVVHSGGVENISYPQILSQIAAANRDLQNLPGNAPPANDCQIQLCLATKLPNNAPWPNPSEPGVTRTQSAQSIVQISNDAALKAIDYQPSDKYLNVWVVKRIDNGSQQGLILGYATFPGTVQPTLDGIVMDYRVMGANPGCCGVNFGTFPTLLASNDQGKVFAHEVGHWLDIYHTFHGGCQIGDQVADTPWEANNFWGCPSGTPTTFCANFNAFFPAPIHNFMDYTDDGCRWEFTPGQKARMWAAINNYQIRSKLVSPQNLVDAGACAPTIFATINVATQVCANTPVPCSTNPCSGCTYTWGGTGTFGNPNAVSTTVTFATPGKHSVTLTVSDGTNTSSNVVTVYASACTPITGACTNWVGTTRIGLSFASGMPVAVPGRQNTAFETGAQVSDANGNLVFYTDDNKIWKANDTLMPTFAGTTTLIGGGSAHNGALAVPKPGSSSRYFLFQVREWEDGMQPDPLHYSEVDANDVISGQLNLNIPLPGSPKRLVEGMTLIPHCNGTDWWLVTTGSGQDLTATNNWTQFIYVTPITAAGPGVTVAYNNGIGGPAGQYSAWGALTASRDGSRLAIIQAQAQSIGLYTFNRSTGAPTLLYNTGNIDANHDCAFSPNGQILYFTWLKPGTQANGWYGLRQLDIASQQVRTITTPQAPGGDLDPRLGPDGKIYVGPSSSTSLHCINFPDQFNVLNNNECGFNPYSIPLPAGSSTTYYATLPNLLPICSASPQAASFTYKQTNCTTVQFTTPNCGPWTWTFGDGSNTSNLQNPSHMYAPGTYVVTLNAPNASPPSVQQTITIGNLPIAIAGPNMSCGGPFSYTAVGPSSYNYSWTITNGSPASATGSTVLVSWGLLPGSITLTATDPATGCVSTASMGVEICAQCTPPPLDMVAWWPLDEGLNATLAQEIVAGNDGTETGANSPAKVAGVVLNAGQFDGTTSIVRVPNVPKLDLGTGDLTLDAWIRTSSGNAIQGIVEKRLLSPKRGYALYLKQGRPALELGDGSTIVEYWASSASAINDGNWHHVAATENRTNTTSGTCLYVDGALVATFAGYASGASLANTEKLVIGAEEPASQPVNWFAGGIDEVEIFRRALAASEIQKIWGAGPAGKCKESVIAQKNQMFCPSATTVTAYVKVCNLGTTTQTFNVSFTGAPGCTGPSPNAFAPPATQVTVSPGAANCATVQVVITKPANLLPGQTSCWKATATNISTGVTHVSKASLWSNNLACVIVTGGGWGNTGRQGFAKWTITNPSPVALLTQGLVMVEPEDDDEPLPPSSVSLNGLPPGSPWFMPTTVIAPGDSVSITVDAAFVLDRPFHHYDLSFYADLDDDGQFDLGSSTDLGYDERPADNLPVTQPVLPAELRLAAPAPNPFRGETRLEFQLPRVSWVKLSLFDLMGRRVRVLADRLFEPGRHDVSLAANGLSSGLYFIRLESRGEVRSQRVVLLRE